MIRINLLPHREARRKQNKIVFFRMLAMAGVFAAAIIVAVGAFIATRIKDQDDRNEFIKVENKKLDEKIKDIASLKQDIEALRARQQAVEDLQSDRNQPVHLMDELVKQVPVGIYLRSFKQDGQKVSLSGVAQSNEKVAQLLHNLTSESLWLEHPELVEIKSSTTTQGKDTKRTFDFTMSAGIRRQSDQKSPAGTPGAVPGTPAGNTAVVPAAASSTVISATAASAAVNTDKPVIAMDKTTVAESKIAPGKSTSASAVGGSGASSSSAPKKP